MRELLADLLQQATRRGATAADAFVVADQSFSAQVRLGHVDTVKHAREQHMALRVFVGKSVAAASTSDLSPESVARLVDEAVSLARITSPDEMGGLPEAAELARQVPDLDLRDPRGHDLSPEEKIELARRCEAAALEADPRITNSEGGDFSDRRALRLRHQPRLRGRVRDVLVQPRGFPGGERERRDAARFLVPRHPQARAAREI